MSDKSKAADAPEKGTQPAADAAVSDALAAIQAKTSEDNSLKLDPESEAGKTKGKARAEAAADRVEQVADTFGDKTPDDGTKLPKEDAGDPAIVKARLNGTLQSGIAG